MKRLLDRSSLVHERLQKNQDDQRMMKNRMNRHSDVEDKGQQNEQQQNEQQQKNLTMQRAILEERLQKHESKAIQLYQEMDARLEAEERLKKLRDK